MVPSLGFIVKAPPVKLDFYFLFALRKEQKMGKLNISENLKFQKNVHFLIK